MEERKSGASDEIVKLRDEMFPKVPTENLNHLLAFNAETALGSFALEAAVAMTQRTAERENVCFLWHDSALDLFDSVARTQSLDFDAGTRTTKEQRKREAAWRWWTKAIKAHRHILMAINATTAAVGPWPLGTRQGDHYMLLLLANVGRIGKHERPTMLLFDPMRPIKDDRKNKDVQRRWNVRGRAWHAAATKLLQKLDVDGLVWLDDVGAELPRQQDRWRCGWWVTSWVEAIFTSRERDAEIVSWAPTKLASVTALDVEKKMEAVMTKVKEAIIKSGGVPHKEDSGPRKRRSTRVRTKRSTRKTKAPAVEYHDEIL